MSASILRARFGEPGTLYVLRVGEQDGRDRSLLYRIVLADQRDQAPQIEALMDYDGWLTDFWRHDSKTFFLGNAEGELYVVDAKSFRGYQPQERGISQIFGRALDEVYAVAASGMILRWDGDDWTSIGPANEVALFAIGDTPDGRLVAAGHGGVAFVQEGAGWRTIDVPTKTTLTAVGRMCGATYLGGERGACYRLRDTSVEAVSGPSAGTYGFADYRGAGYAAAQADGVLVLDGERLVPFARPVQADGVEVQDALMAVYGDDRLAVFDGEAWREIDLGA